MIPDRGNSGTERSDRGQGLRLAGTAISPGLAAGEAFVYRDPLSETGAGHPIASFEIDAELARLKQARESVLEDLEVSRQRVQSQMKDSLAEIFRAHERMLRDPVLLRELSEDIEAELLQAEEAVRRVFSRWMERFRTSGSHTTAARAEDVADLARRLLRALRGVAVHPLEEMPDGSVLVAQRLAPSDAVHFCSRASAVVVEYGTPGAHCALMARQMGIPVVGNIQEVVKRVSSGSLVLVDGFEGTVLVNPGDEAKAGFEAKRVSQAAQGALARRETQRPAVTPDGVTVQVMANITNREDVELAVENGADGVGLYRTEALFMYNDTLPTEDELVETLLDTLEPLGQKPCIVRLLDIGGDKTLPYLRLPPEESPFLGRRGIRLLFAYPELLNVQIRAILRLSTSRAIQIMVPMVTIPEDMERVRRLVGAAAQELGIQHLPPLVAMIETPAAALSVADVLKSADALSIGTNDLTQYVMAAGRQNPLASEYFQEMHPAVMRLIRIVCADAGPSLVGVCGELAGRLSAVPDLLSAGVRLLSVAPRMIPLVKDAVRRTPASPGGT